MTSISHTGYVGDVQVTVLSGAGISAESGVPTFRDVETGLWAKVDPYEISSAQGWRANPEKVWAWYLWRHYMMDAVQPNNGHRAVAAWQDYADVHVVTQNVDDLHERAGSEGVVHVHGHLLRSRCIDCGATRTPDPITVDPPTSDDGAAETPPRCDVCGGNYRPAVVWFGEALPDAAWAHALEALRRCDRVVVVGTSGLVQPAASLPALARELGKPLLEINPQRSGVTAVVDEHWPMPASTGLQRLLDGYAR